MTRKRSARFSIGQRKAADRDHDKFEIALAFHREGNLNKAMGLYERILKARPNHLGALHLAALVFIDQKRPDLAEQHLRKAVLIAGDLAPIRVAYGVALFDLGRFDDALANYEKAIIIDPVCADALYNRGNILRDFGRVAEAVADYERVIAIQSEHAEAYSNLGDLLQTLRRFEDALLIYAGTISIKPDYAPTYSNLGLALHNLRRFDEALASFSQAIAINIGFSAAYFNRANTLKEAGRVEEAIADYARAICIEPGSGEAYSNWGDVLQALGLWREALALYDKAIILKAGYVEACSNRGVCLRELGLFKQALASFDKAISFQPDYAEAHWNKALTLLLMGRFEEGWRLYEWRKKAQDPVGNRVFNRPGWLGLDDIKNKTLLVHGEQGFGDVIQFARYLRCLNEMGAKILFAPYRELFGLMRELDANFELVDIEDASLEFDYHIPLMSLPLAFKTGLSNIPAQAAYLHANNMRVAEWKKKIGPDGFKIGVCWQGGTGPVDAGRSFSLRHFCELSQIPGLRLISLQKGPGEAQLLDLPKGMIVETLGANFDEGPDAFVDTAAVMMCCDLIITSDTSVAHLAGALGVKTWVALKHVPDWRWLREREDSPWYPTMRLFRQTSQGDWEGVFVKIKAALVEALG